MTIDATRAGGRLDDIAVDAFRQSLRGRLIGPTDPDYDEARKVYNGMIDRKPALIARCVDVGDVITSVNFAREQGLLLAIRSGGHNGPGLGVADDALVIDLGAMRGIRIDPVARTARVEAGCRFGDVDHATHAFGLAVPSGIISTTGVGGLTLGGGIGHLSRQCGLTIDNLLEVDMVLADGRFVTANAEQHPDLFWAVRGGGGNFGVVTSFLYRLHPIDTVYAGPMLWHMDRADEALRWYRDFLPAAPDELNGFFAFLAVPAAAPFPDELHGKIMCGVIWNYTGPKERAEETFKPIRELFGGPALDWVQPLPMPALQSLFDAFFPAGLQWYWKADFFDSISDEAVALHVEHAKRMPLGPSTMHLYPVDGVAGRADKDGTAWGYRDAKWAEVIVGVSPEPADKDRITTWAREYWTALHPHSMGGAYVNFMMDEGSERVRATYRDHYDRLAAIKAKYDANNLFRVNQNIAPR